MSQSQPAAVSEMTEDLWTIILPPERIEPSRSLGGRVALNAFSVSSVALLTTVIWWAWTFFAVGASSRITGRVVSLAGDPLAGVVVSLPEAQHSTATAQDGTFTLANLRAGEYWLAVESGSSGIQRIVRIDKGATFEIGDIPVFTSGP